MSNPIDPHDIERPARFRGTIAAVPPSARELAWRILQVEAGGRKEPEALAEAAERAYLRLRSRLAGLIGLEGYRALFARALRMAQTDYPALERITLDGHDERTLEGARDYAVAHGTGDAEFAAGLTTVFAHVIGLLITFIGEEMALRLIREAWPEIAQGETATEG